MHVIKGNAPFREKLTKCPLSYTHTLSLSLSPRSLCLFASPFCFCTYLTYGCLVQAFFKVLSSLLLVQALSKVPSSLLPFSYIPCPLSIVSEAVFFHACIIACTGKNWLPRTGHPIRKSVHNFTRLTELGLGRYFIFWFEYLSPHPDITHTHTCTSYTHTKSHTPTHIPITRKTQRRKKNSKSQNPTWAGFAWLSGCSPPPLLHQLFWHRGYLHVPIY